MRKKLFMNLLQNLLYGLAHTQPRLALEVGTPWFSCRQGPGRTLVHNGFLAKAVAALQKGVPPRASISKTSFVMS